MSIAQTYFLAHTARAKLSREAQRSDHNLRLLVGHANMLDCLMLELAEAEKEQERWFNQSARRVSSTAADSRHIRWADRVVETSEDWDNEDALLSDTDTDSDNESDYGHDDRFFVDVQPIPSTPTATVTPVASHHSYDDDEEEQYEDDLEEDYSELALTRTNSHSHQPPELLSDDESEEEDASPPSPPQPTFDHFSSTKETDEALVPSPFYTSKPSTPTPTPRTELPLPDSTQPTLLDPGFFLPTQGAERIVEAF